MKIRTDFVTNSSSSSFIFKKNTSMKELKEEIKEGIRSYDREIDGWDEDYCEHGIQMLEVLEGSLIPVQKLDIEIVDEIFSWYYDKLINEILGISKKEEDEEPEDYTEEQLYKIFHCFALDLILHEMHDFRYFSEEPPLTRRFTYSEMESAVTAYIEGDHKFYYFPEKVVYQIFMDNYEKGMKFFKENSFSCLDLFQKIFDCKYVFYENYEVNAVFSDILKGIPSCTYACSHMG